MDEFVAKQTRYLLLFFRYAAIALAWLLVYSPFILIGYFIAKIFLKKETNQWVWIGVIAAIGFAIFIGFSFIKEQMFRLHAKRNGWWIFLLLICFGLGIVLPIFIVKEFLFVSHVDNTICWLLGIAAGVLSFFKHGFLRKEN